MIIGALVTMAFFFAYTEVKSNAQNLGFTCAISFCLVCDSTSVLALPCITTDSKTEHLLRHPIRLHTRSTTFSPSWYRQRHIHWLEQDHGYRQRWCRHWRQHRDACANLHLRCAVHYHGSCFGQLPLRANGEEE